MTSLAEMAVRPAPLSTRADPLRKPSYIWFILPALVATVAIIVFPWIFTIWMSFHEWKIGGAKTWVGLRNYVDLATN